MSWFFIILSPMEVATSSLAWKHILRYLFFPFPQINHLTFLQSGLLSIDLSQHKLDRSFDGAIGV